MIEILRLSMPISVWIMGFSAVYALQGLTCSRHWPANIDAGSALLVGWAVAVALQILCLAAILRAPSPSRFVQATAVSLAVTALIAAVWTMLPVLTATLCG